MRQTIFFLLSFSFLLSFFPLKSNATLIKESLPLFQVQHPNSNDKQQIFCALFSTEEFKKSVATSFDVKGFADRKNARILFLKSSFTLNENIDHSFLNFIASKKFLKLFYKAKKIRHNQSNTFSVYIGPSLFDGRPASISFEEEISIIKNGELSSATAIKYIDAIDGFDTNLPMSSYYIISKQNNFNRIFQESISITKIIPYENSVLFIIYSLTHVRNSACEKIDMIPFVASNKNIPNIFEDLISDGYRLLNRISVTP